MEIRQHWILSAAILVELAFAPWLFAQNASVPASPLKTHEGDFVVHDFRFGDGETLPELRLHYTTRGSPRCDASRRFTNAVLILHGTGGSGHRSLRSG